LNACFCLRVLNVQIERIKCWVQRVQGCFILLHCAALRTRCDLNAWRDG